MEEDKITVAEATTSRVYEKKDLMKIANLLVKETFTQIKPWEFEDYGCESKDSLVELILCDYENIAVIAALILKGKLTEAYKLTKELDTLIKDIIPREVWGFLDKYSH